MATAMAAGCNRERTTWNCWQCPTEQGTDLYAGAINLYKCQISGLNPTCVASPFINLTHVYGVFRSPPRLTCIRISTLWLRRFRFPVAIQALRFCTSRTMAGFIGRSMVSMAL